MIVADCVVEEKAGNESRDVSRVAGYENDAESSPDVDKELVGPGLGRLEGHQVTTQ